MAQRKVKVQRVISTDGRAITEAKSEVITSDNAQVHQSLTAHLYSNGSSVSSVSVSSSSVTSKDA